MNRRVSFALNLFVALFFFSFFSCRQGHATPKSEERRPNKESFRGVAVGDDIVDVEVSFGGDEFRSFYEPGSTGCVVPPLSAKYSHATVRVTVGSEDAHVKIKGRGARRSPEDSYVFLSKLRLSTGTNIIPILVYEEDEKHGKSFKLEVERRGAEGALRLTHLKATYTSFSGSSIETEDFVDALPFNGVYERRIASRDGRLSLQVGSPGLDLQEVEVDSVAIQPSSSFSEYKTYDILLSSIESVCVDITVHDREKGASHVFNLCFRMLSQEEQENAEIGEVCLTTEDGVIFDFSKLDISSLEPFQKGLARGSNIPVDIESIFKLDELLIAPIDGAKPALSIKPQVEGSKVELLAIWNDVDHDQTSRANLQLEKTLGWDYDGVTFADYSNILNEDDPNIKKLFVMKGRNTDSEYKFTPYDNRKFDFLIKVTSPDGTCEKFHEVKYSFPFIGAVVFNVEPFKAMLKKNGSTEESFATVVRADAGGGVFNVYVPNGTESVRLVANDRYCLNYATGVKKKYKDIWDYRFYLSVDGDDFSRTHPQDVYANAEHEHNSNYREVFLSSSIGVEEHRLSIVSFQDGQLKNGRFVDEFDSESGVIKVQNNFVFNFIKEERERAPSLSVLRIEGTPSVPSVSAVQGKIWPVMEFRPSVHEYTMALPEQGMSYKLKMLKTDSNAVITVDGRELGESDKESFTQKVMSSNGFDSFINGVDESVEFYSYELKGADYYEGGRLKPCVVRIGIRKGGAYREYSLALVPIDPHENDIKVHVIDSNGGSARSGARVLYREHVPNRELGLTGAGKLDESQFMPLGTTDASGMVSGRGLLKAGKYYDIYAVGDVDVADSMIEHYYVSGMQGETLNLSQYNLLQGGAGGAQPVRGACPVRLKRQARSATPGDLNDGVYFFFRQKDLNIPGSPFVLKPINLTCGDAHIKMQDSSSGAFTDMVAWFDTSSGNSVEPVAWGPDGMSVAFGNAPYAYSYSIKFTKYGADGKVSMDAKAVETDGSMRWDFPSGVYDLVLVAYDVAGNRLERHQMVSIESAHMNAGANPSGSVGDESRKISIENFRVSFLRWPVTMSIFESPAYFENLFGMPLVEYLPPDGQGALVSGPSSFLAIARLSVKDDMGPIDIAGIDLYRRCVEDDTPFQKVASTIPPLRSTIFRVMDADSFVEEGKTYQYKAVVFIDEGSALETDYLAEVKVPPACMYFLDRITVAGQGGGIDDGAVYKYNANKQDENIPILKTKRYDSTIAQEERERIKIDYSARLSTSELWNAEMADEIEAGITLFRRDGEPVFASKFIIAFDSVGDEELLMYVPSERKYFSMQDLVRWGVVPYGIDTSDLVEFDRAESRLTVKDAYLRISALNWVDSYTGVGEFNYEPGNTYYWDIVSFGKNPIGDNVSALTFTKSFKAKNKTFPYDVYIDESGNEKMAGIYAVFGNGDADGANSVNGRCRFTVIQE